MPILLLLVLASIFVADTPSVQGEGAMLLLEHGDNAVFTATSFLLDRRETVQWARDGAVIVDSPYAGGNTARARNFAEQFGLRIVATDTPPAPAFELRRPRVGVLRSRWVESLLNQYKVPFGALAGGTGLRARFDSIVLAEAASLDASALEAFVREGGTLVALGDGAAFAVRSLGLAVVMAPGGERAHFDTTHPVAFGMPAEGPVFWKATAGFEFQAPARAIATFGKTAAVLEYPLGRGRVLLFGFEPQLEGETRLLLNTVYWASAQPL